MSNKEAQLRASCPGPVSRAVIPLKSKGIQMSRNNVFNVCLFFLLVVIACNSTKQSEKEGTTHNSFIGTWKFISLVGESTEGDILYPYGENLYGKLMYDPKGNMSVFLMRQNRPKFVSGDIYKGTSEEIKFAFENFDAYSGTYRIDVDKGTVTHCIEGSRFPNWEGTNQVRYYKISNDTLTLSATLVLQEKEWELKALLTKY